MRPDATNRNFILPILFLYYEESLISSNLNSKQLRFHGAHPNKGAMATLGLSDSYVGRQAQTLQGILNIRQPFKQGCVQHWDDLELLWDHTWKQELKRMRVSF